jgi:phospholipid/cholesterol/gamma-HCH transport system substrate-binding protein
VAGASYLEITRASGVPLDRDYTVLTAIAEQAPTDAASGLIAELRRRVVPLIEDAQAAIRQGRAHLEGKRFQGICCCWRLPFSTARRRYRLA